MRTARTAVASSAGAVAAVALACLVLALPVASQSLAQARRWIATWATASVARAVPPPAASPAPAATQPSLPRVSNQTLRQIVRISAGGERVRLVLSNAFGNAPLTVGAARVALRSADGALDPKKTLVVTFSGRGGFSIPPGALAVSDPVPLAVPPLADVIVDLFLAGDTVASSTVLTTHTGAQQTNYLSTPGDHTGAPSFPVEASTTAWFFLARIEVETAQDSAVVVAFGDSITDGARSTVDTNSRWPDLLARRARQQGMELGIVNAGISGNRLLGDGAGVNALARFERDVLAHPGVTHLVVMHGINDVGRGAGASDVIAAHEQLIRRARAHGLRAIGVTLTPIEGTTFQGYYTPEHEATRQAVNEWIRGSGSYDAVVDADAVLRDPARPSRLRADYASSDFIHPNDLGYRAIADAVDVSILRRGRRPDAR